MFDTNQDAARGPFDARRVRRLRPSRVAGARRSVSWSNAAMRTLKTLFVACVLAVAASPAMSAPEAPKAEPATAAIGKPAPGFKLTDLDGKEVTLASFK